MKTWLIVVLSLLPCLHSYLVQAAETIGGYSPEQAMELGQRMYREGVLPSGEPVQAMVMGDIPVDGRMFTCSNCHQRSGLGSREGTVITWPVNGRELSSPRRRTGAFRPPQEDGKQHSGRQQLPEYFQVPDVRPPYTDETLTQVIRTGVDSAGNHLSQVMPRYRLDDDSMAILVYYLQHLSTTLSPGIDDTTLQFATVIGGDVSLQEKNAMLAVLQAHIDAHNSQSRNEEKRAVSGPFFHSEKNQAYRRLKLHVWELHGPETSWRSQLEKYYHDQPVFALLGGISNGSWEVIHTFCEENEIPCLFPITDLPEISDSDWYTLYFSKGQYQEGETAARYLRNTLLEGQPLKVVQVYDPHDIHSLTLANGFSSAWQNFAGTAIQDLLITDEKTLSAKTLDEIFTTTSPVVLLVWLDEHHRKTYRLLADYIAKTSATLGSATILHDDFSIFSDNIRQKMLFTYPYSSRQEDAKSRMAVEQWLKIHKIQITDFNIQAKMYFLGWMLPGALRSMRSEYFRDYFLERFDMMPDQNYAIAVYPRLSFGPGQRYASKQGCYIVKIAQGSNSEVIPVNDWIIY